MSQLDLVQQFLRRARDCQSESDLWRLLEAVTVELGFQYFALITHIDLTGDVSNSIRIENYPVSWAEYFVGKRLYLCDPVLQASLTSHVGFAWSEVPAMIRITSRQRSILEKAARHGLGAGFTVPANIPGESNGSCSFATRCGAELPACNLMLAQLIGAFAFQAARRLKRRDMLWRTSPRRLTPRQRECLILAIQGKTDWEISRILGLGEETVSQHLNMARARYGVTKRLPLAIHTIFDGQISFMEALAWQSPLRRE